MHTSRQDGNAKWGQRLIVWPARTAPPWRRIIIDSMLAIAGVTLVTLIIATAHLYPRLPSSVLCYLLVIVMLASLLGNYAAILASLLASFAFDFFLAPLPEPYMFAELDDVLDPAIFLATAIVTGQLTAVLRKHTEQARRRERETRLLAEQAQELAALHERQRIARELHDSVSQALYGISLGAQTARDALNRDPADVATPLDYVIALAEAGMADMRALIFELRPESLASEGIVAALNKQVAVLRTHYKLEVDAQLGEEPNIALECKQALYRIAQETLHNIVKHACAHTVLLRLSMRDDALLLEVCDDGKGFDPTEPFPGHLGIRSIQERTASLDGVCSIESAPAQGTCLRVHIPAHSVAGLSGKHI
ncbi:MAG: two-component sensor, putative [Ktedonobacterales bacterium]|jgi:signal transduction histidine kinase|nr:MAG: two-component sensor, putative [Ktedonobacterales bacterium]